MVIKILLLGLIFLLTSCGMTARFPSYEVVERAIVMQINPSQIYLSQNLSQSQPRLDITKVKIRQSKITIVENLPTYHLRGSYQVNLHLSRHKFQQNQPFDLYIQQQTQNKSWRLLIPKSFGSNNKSSWHSYLIQGGAKQVMISPALRGKSLP